MGGEVVRVGIPPRATNQWAPAGLCAPRTSWLRLCEGATPSSPLGLPPPLEPKVGRRLDLSWCRRPHSLGRGGPGTG